jgi:hypothetical protein
MIDEKQVRNLLAMGCEKVIPRSPALQCYLGIDLLVPVVKAAPNLRTVLIVPYSDAGQQSIACSLYPRHLLIIRLSGLHRVGHDANRFRDIAGRNHFK